MARKFLNETNGVSSRRFLRLANPRLSGLITARLGDERWPTDLERLRELEAYADHAEFRAQWREVKRLNKLDLAAGTFVPTGSAWISICSHDELNLAVLFPVGPK